MSVAPDDWRKLHYSLLDSALDDEEPEQVWFLLQNDLGADLTFRPDDRAPERHGFIEPSVRMTLEQYEAALAATRPFWQLYLVTEEELP